MRSARLATLMLIVGLAIASSAQAQEVVEYYGTDALGSVRVVFDAAGNVVARADYLPYGEELAAVGPMPAEHFTGQARDAEAGMDYFHARQYQPRSGRFKAVDPVYAGLFDPQQWNRYAYARGNPLSFADPSGLNVCGGEDYCWGGFDEDMTTWWHEEFPAEYGGFGVNVRTASNLYQPPANQAPMRESPGTQSPGDKPPANPAAPGQAGEVLLPTLAVFADRSERWVDLIRSRGRFRYAS